MEHIPDHDKYLDPPDWSIYDICEKCQATFDNDDLKELGSRLLCYDCYSEETDEVE